MIEDNPDWQLYTRMMKALYQRSTARTSIAGTVESISHITAETLYDCHKAFYTPSNMILTVVGDVDPVHVADLARRILPREGGPAIPRDYGQEPDGVAEKETCLSMEVSSPQFLTAYKCAPAADGEDYLRTAVIGDMACDILLGDSSPLYLRLYDQGLLNTSFGGAFEMMPGGVAYLYAGGDSRDARTAAARLVALSQIANIQQMRSVHARPPFLLKTDRAPRTYRRPRGNRQGIRVRRGRESGRTTHRRPR